MTDIRGPGDGSWQATAVEIAGRALLIEGEPGIGKTSLALALIDRGARLIGDDGVLLEIRGTALWAHPHPNTRGLIEIRNVGIATLDPVSAPVALAVVLARDAPRHVEHPETRTVRGIALPTLTLWPDSPVLALRAEMALAMHGVSVGATIGDSGARC